MCKWWWVLIIMLMTSLAGRIQPLEEIRAAVILPEDPKYVISLPRVLPVLELAASRVSHLLPGHVIHFIPTDDNCTADYALKNAVMVKMCPGESKKLHVIFGPSCEYAVALVGRLMKFWQTPLLTTGALTYDFTNPKTAEDSEFHLLIRLGHLSFKPMSEFIVSILQSYNWSKLLLVYEKDGGKLLSGRNTCKLMMETLVGVLKNYGILYSAYDLEKDGGEPKAEYLSREMNNHYSIVVVCADPPKVRELLLVAEELNMIDSGEYVFFNIELFNSTLARTPWYVANDTEERNNRAKKAFTALLTVTAKTPDSPAYLNFSNEIKALAKESHNFTFGPDPVSTFVTAFYDAVLLYAQALNETLAFGYNESIGKEITRRMWNRTLQGITGRFTIDENGDRITDYSLMDMDPETNTFKIVAHYIGAKKTLEPVPGTKIHWAGGRLEPPPDKPICGFDNSLCKTMPVYAILSLVLSSIVILLAIASAFMYRLRCTSVPVNRATSLHLATRLESNSTYKNLF